jgi:hypothetical protein
LSTDARRLASTEKVPSRKTPRKRLAEPDGEPLTMVESMAPLEVVGYRGGLTPEVTRVLLRGPGGAA